MESADVVIVGAGPAGSTCAWKLQQAGMKVLVLDRAAFPRPKPCAGWVTPAVWRSVGADPNRYPSPLTTLPVLHIHLGWLPIPVPTRQFAVRRVEFDPWLLKHHGVPVQRHTVRHVRRDGNGYIIDETYRCRWLVGAGGTGCPVYRTFFRTVRPRRPERQIISLELEFRDRPRERSCHLWFFSDRLPGYGWYLPKADGWVNLGVGGVVATLKKKGQRIRDHWDHLVHRCLKKQWLTTIPGAPVGYSYYLRLDGPMRTGNALIAGDAAGLATLDMGEGIGPAVESGHLVSNAILTGTEPDDSQISKWSLPEIIFPARRSRIDTHLKNG